MKFVFWWDIPCKGIAGVIREFSNLPNVNVIVITGSLSASRRKMGWNSESFYPAEHIILEDELWELDSFHILDKFRNYYHIFNGYYHPIRIRKVINKAVSFGIRFSIFSEAPSNFYNGLKFYLAKFYYDYLLFFRSRLVVSNAEYIFCLSGSNSVEIKKLLKIGWEKNQIIPFGYFTDVVSYDVPNLNIEVVNIFCPGNLVPHKGVDVLINALFILKRVNTSFHCHITGDGLERNYLESLVKKLDLSEFITFHGVLPQDSYDSLQKNMDILIAPGRIEPWGIRINEAIQRGQAVIVSDQIGAKELILASKGGIIFKSGDFDNLADAIFQLISNKSKLYLAKENNLTYRHRISPKIVSKYVLEILLSKNKGSNITPQWL